MDENTRLVDKINGQLNSFAGSLSKGLSKPKKKFIFQMLFGTQAACDIKLSQISRALSEEIKLIKTENRLSRNMRDKSLSGHINTRLASYTQGRIEKDTVMALDITAIEKVYAKKRDYLAYVWDGMDKEPVSGYWVIEAVAANIYDEYLLP